MFGLPASQNSSGYSGSDSYRHIEKLIKGSGSSLKVVTPFISEYYSRMLFEASKRKSVYVIVSRRKGATTGRSQRAAIDFLESKAKKVRLKPVLALAALTAVVFSMRYYSAALLLFALTALAAYLSFFSRLGMPRLHLKVSDGPFIHEKLYITEDTAIVGSANLTYSGMHRNIEHIEIIKDRSRIRELSSHFDRLWVS